MKKTDIIFFVLLAWLGYTCTTGSEVAPVSNGTSSLSLDTRALPPGLMDNMRLCMFDGDNRNGADGQYYKEILNITRSDDKLTMDIETGLWNIAMVSCENNTLSQLVPPVRGSAPADLLMWRTQPASGVLPNTPDIRTELLRGVNVLPEVSLSKPASLDRHVGMVRVSLTEGVGFKAGAVQHTVYLKNVPTALSWGGSLYPNKTAPEHSGNTPMQGTLTFADTGSGTQVSSNMAEFIVPTHQSANDTDTTTHKLTLGVKFQTLGGTYFEKEVVIPRVPRDNRILQVNVIAKGGVEVKTTIADWNLDTSSPVSPQLYTMQPGAYDAVTQEWTFNLTMHQERNWWVTIGGSNPQSFEFVDATATSGQAGTTAIKVKRAPGWAAGHSAMFYLHVSGYGSQAVGSWPLQ